MTFDKEVNLLVMLPKLSCFPASVVFIVLILPLILVNEVASPFCNVVNVAIVSVLSVNCACNGAEISTCDNAELPKLTFAIANLLLLSITSCFDDSKFDIDVSMADNFVSNVSATPVSTKDEASKLDTLSC